jgi:hypothetical protein
VARSRSGRLLAAGCLLLAGCASPHRSGTAQVPAQATVDWLDRAYTVTCDGLVPGGLRAAVVGGEALVPSSGGTTSYDHYDVHVRATAEGDVDGDGDPDEAVLLECAPQPSNFFVQEVQLFSASGRLLGALPSPRTLQGDAQLPPLYDPAGLSIQHGRVVATMTAYGPQDSHASGPSVPLVERWRFDGSGFVHVSS